MNYDVVIQNSNNINNKDIRWPEEIEKKLESYVKSGGGLFKRKCGRSYSFSTYT